MFASTLIFIVLKEPPFEVSEQGYASFMLPIDIYFKNKGDPKKVSLDYDIFLRLTESVTNTRRGNFNERVPQTVQMLNVSFSSPEKLTFLYPAEDFKKRLIKAGGVSRSIFFNNYNYLNLIV